MVNGNQIGSSVSPLDSGLLPLADNGGSNHTHELLPSSLAINAGDHLAAVGLTTDQRGLSRVVGGMVDIGAIEHQALVVSTVVDEDDADFSAGDLSLREAIGLANATSGEGTIIFDPNLSGGTITLADITGNGFIDSLLIDDDVVIEGLGRDQLTIEHDNSTFGAIFVIGAFANSSVEMSNLSLQGSAKLKQQDPTRVAKSAAKQLPIASILWIVTKSLHATPSAEAFSPPPPHALLPLIKETHPKKPIQEGSH